MHMMSMTMRIELMAMNHENTGGGRSSVVVVVLELTGGGGTGC
jgi:hypothetical protein